MYTLKYTLIVCMVVHCTLTHLLLTEDEKHPIKERSNATLYFKQVN